MDSSIVCTHDDVRHLIVAHVSGELTLAEALEFVATYRVGKYRTYQLLFDATAATLNAPPHHVAAVADRAGELRATLGQGGAVALVAAAADVLSIVRTFQRLVASKGVEGVAVFRTVAEAEQWLADQ
jgi:hypothetical protein